jgi:hypothetical protein
MYDCESRLTLTAFASDLGHMLAVAAYCLSAFASNIGHVLTITAHRLASFSCRFLTAVTASSAV